MLVSSLSLIIIVIGLIFNTSSFLVFTCNKKMRSINSMIILSFVCITDTLALFTWNLDHFLDAYNLTRVVYLSIDACRFFNWLQYFSMQCSGLLYSLVSVDRYFTITTIPGSFFSKLPFGTPKTAIIWCSSIVIILAILNSHMLFMQGYTVIIVVNITQTLLNTTILNKSNDNIITKVYSPQHVEQVICYVSKSGDYVLYPMWDYANLVIYSIVPFILMVLFNSLLIKVTYSRNRKLNSHLFQDKRTHELNIRKRRLTISLFIITFAFLSMTLPGNIIYAFFYKDMNATLIGTKILIIVDCLMFFQHVSIFFVCLFTNKLFRKVVINILKFILIKVKITKNELTTINISTKFSC